MSDVKNIWVLKQPVSIEDYDGGDLAEVDGHILLQSEIKELFQPLDVESLTEQLDRLIGNAMQKAEMALVSRQSNPDGEDDYEVFDKVKSSAITEVLELIGMKGKSDD